MLPPSFAGPTDYRPRTTDGKSVAFADGHLLLRAAVSQWRDVEARAPGKEGAPKKLRRFSMVAYTGAEMDLAGWPHPVVVDLAGLVISEKSRPILKDHDAGQIVGHTDHVVATEKELYVSGVISGTGALVEQIIASSENGFPWQASIGAHARSVVLVPEGKRTVVNGRNVAGPVYVVRKAKPPLRHARKPDSIYANDRASYQDLCNLLTRTRLGLRNAASDQCC